MFDKLKEKLKLAVSIFSTKTEEEAVEEKLIEEKPVEKKAVPTAEKKKENRKSKEKSVKKKAAENHGEKPKKAGKEKKVINQKEEGKKKALEEKEEIAAETKKAAADTATEVPTEKTLSETTEGIPSAPQKVGFLRGLFSKKEEKGAEETAAEEEIKEKKAGGSKEEAEIKEPEREEKESFFGRVKTSLTTKKISADKFEELFWELELALLENNVSVEVIDKIKEDLKQELVDKPLPRDVPAKIEETLKRTLTEILSFEKIDLLKLVKQKHPFIIALFGINGTGKTTSIAKLAHHFQKNKLSVVIAACDTFRAAAIQQLEEHAEKLGVKIIRQDYGSDAAAVAFDAIKYAEKNKIDVVLLDTAGRLHSNTNLMQELEKIIRVAKPDFKIFVGESITGNDCIEQARKFNELVEMDGAILTKADVDEKGGAPLSISYIIKKPVLFLGIGQRYEDLEEFDAGVVLKRLGF